ncbi:MAG: SH3 domain-containing protein, partial [Bacilli bacterium]|nr:SH3 domain-containing protein [Bacilli bacterium]
VLVFIGALGAGGFFIYKKIDEDKKAWKIEIINETINVREEHGLYEYKVGEVKEGEVYKVLDFYADDPRYVWYKIELRNGMIGWVSSGRKNAYVKEINNPNDIADYEIDYAKPIIRYFDEDYIVYDLNSINYNHLEIEEASEYTITHKVYYEEHPTDRKEPQYWIKYIVTDSYGNTESKIQRIIFTIEPDRSEVLDFSEM